MKTPKEEAKQLKNKFYNKEIESEFGRFEADIDSTFFALVCVNEQLELLNRINSDICDEYEQSIVNIKKELEKL